MIDSIEILYMMGSSLVPTADTSPAEGVSYYKYDYQEMAEPNMTISPVYEGWFELDASTGKYFLTEDTSPDEDKTYYAYRLVEQDMDENDDPSELGLMIMSSPSSVGDPKCTMEIVYNL